MRISVLAEQEWKAKIVFRDLRVLLVEDSNVLKHHITEIIDAIDGVHLVAEADSEAIEAVKRYAPDVVILDLRLRQGTGFGVLEYVRTLGQRPKIVVMTNYAIPAYKRRAEDLGATFFLDKARDFDQLPVVLQSVRGGHDA